MNRLRLRAEGGFTLIELLVVIAIIGILAAIAIPQFAAYRQRSFVSQVTSDIRNMAVAEEARFAQNQAYQATVCNSLANVAACTNAVPGFDRATLGVQLTVALAGAGFTITGIHAQCIDQWTYDSTQGTIVRANAGGTAGMPVCG